ncbi:uncharacterized protein LOC114947815 isoform X2 [Acropora millepora]|nr:uncharacterized protein LOC114947815 isoform X2 [Acropora millepora]XP_044180174.1 uncharacterized protein LOC114947815 isoform X2 [Acropora millepora]
MLHYNLPIIDFDQAGSVYMLNLTTVLHLQKDLILTEMEHNAVFEGDQSFARFGWDVGLMDINEDGIKDLLFSSPFRTNDITEEIRGGINHGQISTGESFNFFLPLKSSPSLVVSPLLVRKWFDSRSKIPRLQEILSNRSPGFLILKMASAQVVEKSVANKSPSQGSDHPDDLFQLLRYHHCFYHIPHHHHHTL